LLGVDNPVYVPVNKVVEVDTNGADVIHSWAVPQFGVKMDAVPGRINKTWFKATKIGVFYGECSELCGAQHAFMPIEVHVVSDADYATWLAGAKKKFASNDTGTATRLAAK
jgi:cytochrome c oxidase subunit 2